MGSGATAILGTAVVTSQLDGPEPFIADLVAIGIAIYAAYQALTHKVINTPLDPNIYAQNNKHTQKIIDGLTTAAERELEKLRYDPPTGGARNHHKDEIKAMLDRAKNQAEKLVGKAKEKALEKIKQIEEAVQEIAPDN